MDSEELSSEFLMSFMKTHYNSLVSNLRIKYKQGEPVWIDIHNITLKELEALDKDAEVDALILESQTIRYRDRD